MRLRLLFTISIALLPLRSWSQSELTISVDNDLYFNSDYYYSSGLFMSYSQERQLDSSLSARSFSQWKLGQLIYTPRKRYATDIAEMDYPFSGYLFIRHQKEKLVPNKRGLRYGVELGISGDASLAQPVQNLYHDWVLQLRPLSWTADMPQQLHLGADIKYFKSLRLTQKLALLPDATAVLSSYKTMGAARLGLLIGSTVKMPFDFNPLMYAQKGWGLYLGWQQQYFLHDFPLEGGLFTSDEVFTLPSNQARNIGEFGVVVHSETWRLQGVYVTSSKDTPGQKRNRHRYLNISISRFF